VIGETIGNFRLVSRLGKGGMGEVFLAEHKDLQTPVAVKLLSPDISGHHDYVQRFFNEARVVSKIKHAGTVKIFDSGFHNEQAYLIMELLEGESLASCIENTPMIPIARLVDIARQMASVLDATHRQGVIHRDLKPDNVFLVHDDERATGERVKILDFGIAKLSGTMASVSPKTKGTMGTPQYMAPEQWGDSSSVDWRVDAYSLGCVMFEMACGRPPFIIETIADAFIQHTRKPPPPPTQLRSDVPPVLEALILRLLSKEPADRAVSMGQVTKELDELLGVTSSERTFRQSEPLPTIPTPAPGTLQMPSKTMTTLGGSAAELQQVSSRRHGLIGGVVAGLIVIGVLVAVVVSRGSGGRPARPTGSAIENGTGTAAEPGAGTGTATAIGSATPAGSATTTAPGSATATATATGSATETGSATGSATAASTSAGSGSATMAAVGLTAPKGRPANTSAPKAAKVPTTKTKTKPTTTTTTTTPPKPPDTGDDLGGRL
jgi:serine/threonine-protein kinase